MQSASICLRKHGNRFDPQFTTGTDNAHRDLASISDQYFFEHNYTSSDQPSAGYKTQRGWLTTYNGIFPCFLAGLVSRLLLSISSALIKRGRVSFGSMTSSI